MNYWNNARLNCMSTTLAKQCHTDMDYFVVDDFLDNPIKARDLVLSLEFEAPPDPERGVISSNGLIPEILLDEMRPKIEHHLHKTIEYHPRSKCAITYKNVPKRNICHTDGGDNMCMFNWTVVVYLNTPEQCQGGTSMYRHIATGDIYSKRGNDFYYTDFRDPSKWELIDEVPMMFNRALFCPAWRFHGLSFTFGDVAETARMTLNPKIIAI